MASSETIQATTTAAKPAKPLYRASCGCMMPLWKVRLGRWLLQNDHWRLFDLLHRI